MRTIEMSWITDGGRLVCRWEASLEPDAGISVPVRSDLSVVAVDAGHQLSDARFTSANWRAVFGSGRAF
jgi:hypothetical protein